MCRVLEEAPHTPIPVVKDIPGSEVLYNHPVPGHIRLLMSDTASAAALLASLHSVDPRAACVRAAALALAGKGVPANLLVQPNRGEPWTL
jgi:hypothetical protein